MAEIKVKKDVNGVGGTNQEGLTHSPGPGVLFEQKGPIKPLPFDPRAMLALPKSPRANLLAAQSKELGTIELGEALQVRTWLALDGTVKGTDLEGRALSAGEALYAGAAALARSTQAIESLTNGLLRKILSQTSAKLHDALKKRPAPEIDRVISGGISFLLQIGLLYKERDPSVLEHAFDIALRTLSRAKSAELVKHHLEFLGSQGELLTDGQFRTLRTLVNQQGIVPTGRPAEAPVPFPGAWT